MTHIGFVGIDWGTTSFRATAWDALGNVVDRHERPYGILQIESQFESVYVREVGPWLSSATVVLACGMIGSRQGWVETSYCPCPATPSLLANSLVRHPSRSELYFVPGISCHTADGLPDVMRGEETQVVGTVDDSSAHQLIVLPGTHSKWAHTAGWQIVDFRTFMTGELYDLMLKHSILGRLAVGTEHDEQAFLRGATLANSRPGLLNLLFSARALPLFDQLPSNEVASYLSGLLIGHETAEALPQPGRQSVTVLGNTQLCRLYQTALSIRGVNARVGPQDAAMRGLRKIAEAACLLDAG